MKNKLILISVCLILFINKTYTQTVWTIGPMLHVNFGVDKPHGSFAIEFAYWNLKHIPFSVDGAIEFESKRFRIYSEMQIGVLITGVSLGPLLQINTDEGSAHLGIQTTLWANYYLGLDYRKRWVDKKKYYCVGTYFKLPIAHHGFKESHSGSNYGNWDLD